MMLIFLQNAWSPVYAGSVWPRKSWLRALAASRSGVKLKMLTDDLSCVHNVGPICAKEPSGVTPVDDEHIKLILKSSPPDVVVACGKHAEAALRRLWYGPLLCLPHPAHRVVTNKLYQTARATLDAGFDLQIALRQQRSGVAVETLQ